MRKNLFVFAVLAFGFVICFAGISLAEQNKPSPPDGFRVEGSTTSSEVIKIHPRAIKKKLAKASLIAEVKKLEEDLLECFQYHPEIEKFQGLYLARISGSLATWEITFSTTAEIPNIFIVERTVNIDTGEDLTTILIDDGLDGTIDNAVKYRGFTVIDSTVNPDTDTAGLKTILNKFLDAVTCSGYVK